jgi:hypothetical protein
MMTWQVEVSAEFEAWWSGLTESERESVDAHVRLLETLGPALGRPQADTIKGSRHPNLKELRVQHRGRPMRILFAFDPRRVAILLLGGDKTGDKRWYTRMVPLAETIFDAHLVSLAEPKQGQSAPKRRR